MIQAGLLSHTAILFEHGADLDPAAHSRYGTEERSLEEGLRQTISQLKEEIEKLKTLRGLLHICCSCKNIKDEEGHWGQIEQYIKDHSAVDFSHGICPDCAKRLYPDIHRD